MDFVKCLFPVYNGKMNKSLANIVIDSDASRKDILIQNPESPAPEDILNYLDILEVKYYGFDGAIHRGQIVINKNIAGEVKIFFETALTLKFPIEKVIPISNKKYKWNDEISCDDNNSSGYNYRFITGAGKMSKHAAGLAFDVNPAQNIYIKYDENMNEVFRSPKEAIYSKDSLGTLTRDHTLVILMKNFGWDWGGNWKPESGRVDYQHFEKNI